MTLALDLEKHTHTDTIYTVHNNYVCVIPALNKSCTQHRHQLPNPGDGATTKNSILFIIRQIHLVG